MGGHALAEAAALHPDAFAALVLADPVIFPPHFYGAPGPDVSFILRRRNRWTSPAEMFERFRPRLPFAAWPEEVVRNYCDYALLPDGDGYVRAGRTWQPGVFDPSASPTAPDIAARFANAKEVFLAENNHFIPMEAPHVMVREIRAVLGRTLDTGAAR